MKAEREAATDKLVRLGPVVLPLLGEALTQETDEHRAQPLANLCVRLGTPAARQLLVDLAPKVSLPARAAIVQALSSFASVPTDAPVFHRLVEEELRLAQHLLHGMIGADAELRHALHYELGQGRQRLLGLLLQVYERPLLLEARRTLARTTGKQQVNALKSLKNLLPRPLYEGLEALVEGGHSRAKAQLLDEVLGPLTASEPLITTIVRRGTAAFTAWTLGVALRQWHPQPATVLHLYPHLFSPDLLVQESARAVVQRLPVQRPAAYDVLLAEYPSLTSQLMATQPTDACTSALERVRMLKGTALFADTPENVLAAIMPIMKEVSFAPEQEIFGKGALGTSLFIICEGEVGIVNGAQQLASFHSGDFFGELALLDAQPRSATAVAHGHVTALRLDQEDFYEVMAERSEVLRTILRVLCQRLRRQNEQLQVQQ
ncbi:hypothetical protein GCM10011383_43160 [Hymenobacter cavernae]|uniref:Cyclic nucleotide-binding domain-containing protein n=1 Tax=Hymenobacter cavernae TaxID=2044852 RepID=A0ABQ1UV76_9BACT|nr:hypothetical protein GCM10011383_43160 [Hymenobacter cavernae]